MRILTITHFFEGHGGGIERVAGHLCRAFARLGASPLWAASDEDAPVEGEVTTIGLHCANPLERLTGLPLPIPGFRALRQLSLAVKASNAVIIHDALYLTSICGMLLAKSQGKRVILIQHISAIPFSSRLLRLTMWIANRVVTRTMLQMADERIFISETVRRDLLGSAARRNSELLFNGVDHAIFHQSRGKADSGILPAGRAAGECRILFVGRYVEKKGLDVLRELARMRPEISVYLVGEGPIRPDGWGLANVHDLGPQSQTDLAALYRAADLLLLPSVGEGFPLVVQEAMACGLPVVCGEPGNRADPEAQRWLSGVVIDLTSPVASAERCSAAIDACNLSAQARVEMAEYAHRRYDWQAMATRLVTLAQDNSPAPAQGTRAQGDR